MRVHLLHNYREEAQLSMKLYADELGTALVRKGLEVVRVQPSGVLPELLLGSRLLQKLDSYAGRFVKYPSIATRLRGDLFHVVDHGFAHLADFLPADRTVVTCHDLILLVLASGRISAQFRPRLAGRVLRQVVARLRRARFVIAVSEQTRRDLLEFVELDEKKIEVVHSGLNLPFRLDPLARIRARTRWRIGNNLAVVHVGQTGFYKNLETVLRVVAQLRHEGLPAVLLRGGQRLTKGQRALSDSLGLARHVIDLGYLPSDELQETYNAGDVLLFPSLYEGFGWPPLEAMASGLPVVCSAEGSLRELVGDAAVTASPLDVDGLAQAVTRVLTDTTYAEQLRRRGFANAQRFNWETTADKMLNIYRRVVS